MLNADGYIIIIMPSALILNDILLSVIIYAEFWHAEGYIFYCYAENLDSEHHFADCYYVCWVLFCWVLHFLSLCWIPWFCYTDFYILIIMLSDLILNVILLSVIMYAECC